MNIESIFNLLNEYVVVLPSSATMMLMPVNVVCGVPVYVISICSIIVLCCAIFVVITGGRISRCGRYMLLFSFVGTVVVVVVGRRRLVGSISHIMIRNPDAYADIHFTVAHDSG